MTIDAHLYRDGHRTGSPQSLADAATALATPGVTAWIGLRDADPGTLDEAASRFDLAPLAIEDAQKGHQRAKLERYGDTMFVVLRPGTYDDRAEQVEFGELHVFVGPRYAITLRRGESPDISAIRTALEGEPDFLGSGPEAMLTALLDAIVDGYAPIVSGLEEDIDQVEDTLFSGGPVDPGLSERIYFLIEQVLTFQRAIGSLPDIVHGLLRGADRYGTDDDVQNRLRNVLDHVVRVTERVATCRSLLENALTVHATLVTVEQNEAMRQMSLDTYAQGEEVKKISSWAAILFTPTLVAGVYGMNFDSMPELHWAFGYPFAVAMMLGLGVGLWAAFKRKRWL